MGLRERLENVKEVALNLALRVRTEGYTFDKSHLNDLEEAILKTQSYINPRKGDCVYVEWGDNYKNYNHETIITGNKKIDTLVYYNNKWFVKMGVGKKITYVPLHHIDVDAIVRKK